MSHDLKVAEPNKVLSLLDESIDHLDKVIWAIETTADISKMNLSIGGLVKTFDAVGTLKDSVVEAKKVVEEVKADFQKQLAIYQQNNEDITI